MAVFEDVFTGEALGFGLEAGLAVGLGMAVLGPVVLPVVGAIVRPVAKQTIKMGMLAYDAVAAGLSNAGRGGRGGGRNRYRRSVFRGTG